MEIEKKETRGICLSPALWAWIVEEAGKQNRSISNCLETLVLEKKNEKK